MQALRNEISVGDIVSIKNNPHIQAYVTKINHVMAMSGYDIQYYVEFFNGPLAEGKHVTYYYYHEIEKVC